MPSLECATGGRNPWTVLAPPESPGRGAAHPSFKRVLLIELDPVRDEQPPQLLFKVESRVV